MCYIFKIIKKTFCSLPFEKRTCYAKKILSAAERRGFLYQESAVGSVAKREKKTTCCDPPPDIKWSVP